MNYKSVRQLPADIVTNDQNKGCLVVATGVGSNNLITFTVKDSTGATFNLAPIVLGASGSIIMNIAVSSWTGNSMAGVYELF